MSSEEKCRKAGLVDQLSGCGWALVQRQFELQNIEKLCKQLLAEQLALCSCFVARRAAAAAVIS